ncbi:methionine aminopeptidase 1D, mitochondrial isoform X4 [Bactrocera dorsalis]|uniref:Methionine aminopeptidase n=1 Tax=Bactrocera dorsalis TaxID=27457 RepID=A0ABM3IYG7_BACDO|nr:methionine aminopeptidase 1D, mitochondrial isoform X4 [Bactrocera dorsalis]
MIYAEMRLSLERIVSSHIKKPDYFYRFHYPGSTIGVPSIKNESEINTTRLSCKMAGQVLEACSRLIKAGTSTGEIDAFAHDQIISAGGYPSPFRYAGFPKSVCTSVNNVACHGIPNERQLVDGDIINVDITVYLNGCHGDCSKTFLVGNVDDLGVYLVKSAEECVQHCINICKPGTPFNAIGRYITDFCNIKKLNVIPAFAGHGLGKSFHEPPEILHYYNSEPGFMRTGMVFTIEPILSLGKPNVNVMEDGWTAVSVDGMRSAQFEHTILITQNGSEALTEIN